MLQDGLEFARIKAPVKARDLDSMLTLVRIDPKHFELRLMMANFHGEQSRSAREWAKEFRLLAVINAGLYLKDHKTSAGLMIDRGKVNNPRLNRWGAILAFNPKNAKDRAVRLVDRRCENFKRIRTRYQTFVQGFRMMTCRGGTTFRKSDKRFSIAALAIDRRGRILFLMSASPYSTYEFSQIIRRLRLDIRRAMYLEGGRDAQLYVKAGDIEAEVVGKCGRFFGCTTGNPTPRDVPNVIGIVPRKAP
jgi:uncharacterized protein YigE (DUF2233 family)